MQISSRALTLSRFVDEAVTIIVGGEKLSFVVHKRLLSEASTFFKNALCGYTQDGAQKSVAICSVEPTTFESFLQWLYSKSLAGEDMMQGQETSSPIFSWSLALKLYTLSHYLQCPAFGSSVIDYIRGRLCDKLCLPMPTAREITEIYSQTPGDCGLRRLIILMHTTMARGGALLNTEASARAWIADVPTDFIKDLAVRLLQEDSGWIPGFWGHSRVVQWIMDGEAECQAEKKGSETVGSIE